jgi:hypothetical protein
VCQGRTSGTRTGPRWSGLYAILPITAGAFILVEIYVPLLVSRGVLALAVGGGAWLALVWWVRANRVALHEVEWCSCASETVRVRVVPSRGAVAEPRWTDEAAFVEPADTSTVCRESREELTTTR